MLKNSGVSLLKGFGPRSSEGVCGVACTETRQLEKALEIANKLY
jgi:hypothetical protein